MRVSMQDAMSRIEAILKELDDVSYDQGRADQEHEDKAEIDAAYYTGYEKGEQSGFDSGYKRGQEEK